MSSLAGKVLFVTGGSRGIGLAIALRAARDGACVTIAAKTTVPHPKLPGTIYTAVEAVEKAGGRGLACVVDVRDEAQVRAAVDQTAATFGGIDILVNNASAISLTDTRRTPLKRFDLMHAINTRGAFACTQACLPHLERAANPHVLMLSPPLTLEPRWFGPHLAYSLSKYGMSLCVLGLAEELRPQRIAVNALWPRTIIATAAVQNLLGGDAAMQGARHPAIVADAAHAIFTRDSASCTGNFFIDEQVLAGEGVTSFEHYAVTPGGPLIDDLFVS
jgi:citronellol/citronellal dehydrogenase